MFHRVETAPVNDAQVTVDSWGKGVYYEYNNIKPRSSRQLF